MHTLHYFLTDDKSFPHRTTIIRSAISAAGTEVGLHGASVIVRNAQRDGVAEVMRAEDQAAVLRAWNVMINGGLAAKVDASEAELLAVGEAPEVEAPAEEAYQTAVALLANAKGNPLLAASYAHVLAGTTGDEELYTEVISVYASIFPWLTEMLRAEGIIQ